MKNEQQIIEKAIEKAVKNGWDVKINITDEENGKYTFITFDKCFHLLVGDRDSVSSIIFNHNFAKAFWGEGKIEKKGRKRVCYSPWKSNLQTMVLKEDPIKYLEKFL